MTEDDAKTKWCPMVRWGDMNTQGGLNRGNQRTMTCVGSDCMMWREVLVPASRDFQRDADGYCGLAGRP